MLIAALVVAALVAWIAVRLLNSLSRPNHQLGVHSGRLADCAESPNCVSTTARRPEQQMSPIRLAGSAAAGLTRLESILLAWPRTRIVASHDRYLHAEFRSFVFNFVDDVEFLIDEANGEIHFRASARVGHSDLGVNRLRMEQIRDLYESS